MHLFHKWGQWNPTRIETQLTIRGFNVGEPKQYDGYMRVCLKCKLQQLSEPGWKPWSMR